MEIKKADIAPEVLEIQRISISTSNARAAGARIRSSCTSSTGTHVYADFAPSVATTSRLASPPFRYGLAKVISPPAPARPSRIAGGSTRKEYPYTGYTFTLASTGTPLPFVART